MKNLLVFFTLLLLSQNLHAGPRVIGNGGDVYALQFVSYANKILLYLQNSQVEGLDIKTLSKAIESAKVESTTKDLKLNGMDKDAINYPTQNRIVFNQKRWSSMLNDERLALVLHEYLGLIGKEDANYQFSKLVLKDMTTISRVRPGSDSSWLLCQDDSLVMNVYEHRQKEDTRRMDLVLLWGGWAFQGFLDDELSGPVELKPVRGNGDFTGDVSLKFDSGGDQNRLSIQGLLTVNGRSIKVNSTLPCAEKFVER